MCGFCAGCWPQWPNRRANRHGYLHCGVAMAPPRKTSLMSRALVRQLLAVCCAVEPNRTLFFKCALLVWVAVVVARLRFGYARLFWVCFVLVYAWACVCVCAWFRVCCCRAFMVAPFGFLGDEGRSSGYMFCLGVCSKPFPPRALAPQATQTDRVGLACHPLPVHDGSFSWLAAGAWRERFRP